MLHAVHVEHDNVEEAKFAESVFFGEQGEAIVGEGPAISIGLHEESARQHAI